MDHWSQFWKQSYLTTFGGYYSKNYTGDIASFWVSQFKSLSKGSILFDVCAGNGAVALLAEKFSNENNRRFQISACDFAKINPPAESNVTFFSNTDLETIKVAGNHFDFISSNYGIEYTDISQSLANIHGMLKPGGRFCALIHSDSSVVMKKCKDEYKTYFRLFNEDRIFDSLKIFFENKKTQNVHGVKSKLNSQINGFISDNPGDELPKEIVRSISTLIREGNKHTDEWVLNRISELELDYFSASQRVKDMINAAISSDEMGDLLVSMGEVGFSCVSGAKFCGQNIEYGWKLEAEKT